MLHILKQICHNDFSVQKMVKVLLGKSEKLLKNSKKKKKIGIRLLGYYGLD